MTATSQHSTSDQLDSTSKAILNRLQSHIPVTPRPFLAVAEELGISEEETIERTRALSEARLIRQISAIFDGRALGYDSCLVAASCAPGALEHAARVVSSHPGVSHNYKRDHDFNLWYTIAVPPGRSLTDEVDTLHRLSGAVSTRPLPATRMFKLGVKLDMEEGPVGPLSNNDTATASMVGPATPLQPLQEHEIQAVRALQDPFPVVARPFDRAAEVHGFPCTDALLAVGEDLRRRNVMRRFAAVLRHREAGFRANGMVVWMATPEECLRAGPVMARFAKVSHCYERPTYEDWPYSLFTMIHGRTPEEVQECIEALQDQTGLRENLVLYSSVEYKKARVRYFTEEWDAWHREANRWTSTAFPGERRGQETGAAICPEATSSDTYTNVAKVAERRMERMRIQAHLQSLQVCQWDIASLRRRDFDAVREAAKLHVGVGVLLTSCQRLEAYSLQGCNCGAVTRQYGFDALLHLAEVAAGLHSVVLGEEQISGQVRSALADAPAGVRELGDIALAAAREVRREASFDSHAGHLLDRGLSAAEVEATGRMLVMGTGHMGRLIARRGRELGFGEVLVAGRRRPEAGWLEEIDGQFVPLGQLTEAEPVDVLVGCLGSEAGEMDAGRELPAVRKLVLDLGTPRNFTGKGQAQLLAIDDLLRASNGTSHRDELRTALREQLREKLERRLTMAATDSKSTVGALRLEVERVRQSEMERIVRLHPELPADTIDVITRALVNRLFHAPSERLKQLDDPELGEQVLALFAGVAPEAQPVASASPAFA